MSFCSQAPERGQSDSRKDKSCSLGHSGKDSWKRRWIRRINSGCESPSKDLEMVVITDKAGLVELAHTGDAEIGARAGVCVCVCVSTLCRGVPALSHAPSRHR